MKTEIQYTYHPVVVLVFDAENKPENRLGYILDGRTEQQKIRHIKKYCDYENNLRILKDGVKFLHSYTYSMQDAFIGAKLKLEFNNKIYEITDKNNWYFEDGNLRFYIRLIAPINDIHAIGNFIGYRYLVPDFIVAGDCNYSNKPFSKWDLDDFCDFVRDYSDSDGLIVGCQETSCFPPKLKSMINEYVRRSGGQGDWQRYDRTIFYQIDIDYSKPLTIIPAHENN